MNQASGPANDHAQALAALEAGRPAESLKIWRHLLCSDQPAVVAHLQAAQATLSRDAIAPLRRQAIKLACNLLSQEPGEHDIQLLGAVLRDWGTLALPEVPSRALQLLERAWSCGRDQLLDQQLSTLHTRLGYRDGAHWLAAPAAELEPWPLVPCAAQACRSCQIEEETCDPALTLQVFEQGRIGLQRHRNPWGRSHGVAVWNQQGELQPSLSRHYPWPWPQCPHAGVFEQGALHQLTSASRELPRPVRIQGPVLAIAELSGEMYFHWQMELLPRLGRVWTAALKRWPQVRLWHNGRERAYVRDGLQRLGIPSERLLPASDHLQASLLLVPSFTSSFGRPSQANLNWLEQFWDTPEPIQSNRKIWLGRRGAVSRPVLAEDEHLQALGFDVLKQGSVTQQLQQMAEAGTVIAPHGAAMANLLGAPRGSRVLELVNPDYVPHYFDSLIQRRKLHHYRLKAAPTPFPLQEWLFAGPLEFPIDLRAGASEAAELLTSW